MSSPTIIWQVIQAINDSLAKDLQPDTREILEHRKAVYLKRREREVEEANKQNEVTP